MFTDCFCRLVPFCTVGSRLMPSFVRSHFCCEHSNGPGCCAVCRLAAFAFCRSVFVSLCFRGQPFNRCPLHRSDAAVQRARSNTANGTRGNACTVVDFDKASNFNCTRRKADGRSLADYMPQRVRLYNYSSCLKIAAKLRALRNE